MFPQRRAVRFAGAQGHELDARLDLPPGEVVAFALLAHCFTCGKDLKAAGWISRALVDRRIAVLRFDFTGLGASAGEFADTNFTTNVEDLVAAAGYLRTHHRAPQILIGHSLGGTAALLAARRIPEVAAVATIAAPADLGHLRGFLEEQTGALGPEQSAEVDVMGRVLRVKGQMLDDLRRYDVLAEVLRLDRPLLVFHSPEDAVVGVEHGRRIFEAAPWPKSFVALDGADHLLIEREADARYVAEVLACWAARYLPGKPECPRK